MSYYGIDHSKDTLPRIPDSRLSDLPRPWHSVKFIDDECDGGVARHDIWTDDFTHRYDKLKGAQHYRHKKRPTSADSSVSSSASSLKDSNEVLI